MVIELVDIGLGLEPSPSFLFYNVSPFIIQVHLFRQLKSKDHG